MICWSCLVVVLLKIDAKDKEYTEEMEKLLEELSVTKNYITTLQKDLDDKVIILSKPYQGKNRLKSEMFTHKFLLKKSVHRDED